MKILGIETSCDETGIALYDGKANQIVFEALYSQAEDGIRDSSTSRGLGDVYKRQILGRQFYRELRYFAK